MRNLKKFLALVLAMMMVMGLMLTANAVDVSDVKEDYQVAATVLDALKIIQGDEGGFRPTDNITRQEFATILYRITTNDATGVNVNLYADYVDFPDVTPEDWAIAYIGYAVASGYMKGDTEGTFRPNDNITGYEAMLTLLRAVGYDRNGEYNGDTNPRWQIDVAVMGQTLNVTTNVKEQLGAYATRQQIAEMVFQSIAHVPMVVPNGASGGYKEVTSGASNTTVTLGRLNYGLHELDETATDSSKPFGDIYKDLDKKIKDELDEKPDPFGRPSGTKYYVAKDGELVIPVDAGNRVATFTSAMSEEEIFDAIGAEGIKGQNYNYIVMDSIKEDGVEVATAVGMKSGNPNGTALTWDGTNGVWKDGSNAYTPDYFAEAAGCTKFANTVIIGKGSLNNNNAEGFGNGVTVEIYDNSAEKGANHYKMVIINEYLG